jgi:hypothetical protein
MTTMSALADAVTRRHLLALVLVVATGGLVGSGSALACTCAWAGPFVQAAPGADLVVLAEVRAHHGRRLDVRVLDVLRGSETHRTITVLGGDDASCRPPVTTFPPGTRWLFALHRPGEARGYGLSACGAYWLEVRGDQAVGSITAADYGRSTQSAPVADVIAWLRSGGSTPLAPVLR